MATQLVSLEYLDLPIYLAALYLTMDVPKEKIISIKALLDDDSVPKEYIVVRSDLNYAEIWRFERPTETWLRRIDNLPPSVS